MCSLVGADDHFLRIFCYRSWLVHLFIMDGFTEALGEEPRIAKKNRPGSPDSAHSRSSSISKNSLQDRLFTKYVLDATDILDFS